MPDSPSGVTVTNYAPSAPEEYIPGYANFNKNNFPSLQKLLEDPNFGTKPDYSKIYDSEGKLVDDIIDQWKKELNDAGVTKTFFDLYKTYESELEQAIIDPGLVGYLKILLDPANEALKQKALIILPRLSLLINAFADVVDYEASELSKMAIAHVDTTTDVKVFGDKFVSAIGYDTTVQNIANWFKSRENTAPLPVQPNEMRLGGSRFFVPPLNIKVSQEFKVGSLSGAAIRQPNSPKFNSGHSETVIDLTLYFPNHQSIWGFDGTDGISINFDAGGDDDFIIDKFLSSLRGLITQFKYAPFLPVRNDYLNRTYGITAVALSNMNISTLAGFPFCVVVNLQLLSFNFKPFIPPISDFNSAIHWGRFRTYAGRAAKKINEIVSEGFWIEQVIERPPNEQPADPNASSSGGVIDPAQASGDPNQYILKYESDPKQTFNKTNEFQDGKFFKIYYPKRTPGRIFAPDTSNFRQEEEDVSLRERDSWGFFMKVLNINQDADPLSLYDTVKYNSMSFPLVSEREKLLQFLSFSSAAISEMNAGLLDKYIETRLSQAGATTQEAKDQVISDAKTVWFDTIFQGWKYTPFFQNYLAAAAFKDGHYTIEEWKVPMEQMYINWDNVIINGLAVNLSNNLVPLQLQLQDEPAYQHIGGKDSTITISMTVLGEDDLIRFRKVFEHINGLARLEQAHGVLGFVGIKNILTALSGIKYALPLSMEVDTVPGFPHVYSVNMSFVDFDIFQQKRELLSSDQQKDLIEKFGKRNPFLRIKQSFDLFNAYPDLPLSVRDDKGKVVGQLDPDFYFRSFDMLDSSIAEWGLSDKSTDPSSQLQADELSKYFTGVSGLSEDERKALEGQLDQAKQAAIDKVNEGVPLEEIAPQFRDEVRQDREKEVQKLTAATFAGLVYDNNNLISSKFKFPMKVSWAFGLFSADQKMVSVAEIVKGRITFNELSRDDGTITSPHKSTDNVLTDSTPERVLYNASIDGLTPYSRYSSAHADTDPDPTKHWELMMTDAQYRDISGRMVRAFPTYMLWLIDEGGRFAGVKLFDNFYGLQSIIDLSIVQSEDILGDTLVLRLSNTYNRLSSPYLDALFQGKGPDGQPAAYDAVNTLIDRNRNIQSGTNDHYLVELQSIRLKPGVRLHLRLGYGGNPSALHTVFNGTITEVTDGDIIEIVAQSDAIELSPVVNTTDKSGNSGHGIDGSFSTGLYMSEPRDLMVRLLSMGSSTFKEGVSHATNGTIFSENKFGIRHFGQILYEPLTGEEKDRHDQRFNAVKAAVDAVTKADPTSPTDIAGAGAQAVGNVPGAGFDSLLGNATARSPIIGIMQSMWANSFRARDYEIFKRNIYPGNGLGIGQFLGGDSLDGGLFLAQADPSQTMDLAVTSNPTAAAQDPKNIFTEATNVLKYYDSIQTDPSKITSITDKDGNPVGTPSQSGNGTDIVGDALDHTPLSGVYNGLQAIGTNLLDVFSGRSDNPILQAFGIAKPGEPDDDLKGFDEISFRAQTYMKSVWDLFQLCAAMLPNYIVAVRPFEDRSTVFYGKPHWMYTSGVIPLTTGVLPHDGPKVEDSNTDLLALMSKVAATANSLADLETQGKFFGTAGATNPYDTTNGVKWSGGDVLSMPGAHDVEHFGAEATGAILTVRTTKMGEEMHLPTHDGGSSTIDDGHIQLPNLPEDKKYPLYMDKLNSLPGDELHGGQTGYDYHNEGLNDPGQPGGFGILSPADEQYYMNMQWDYTGGHPKDSYRGRRILVYAPSTGKACVCTPGDWGPGDNPSGIGAGGSPDVMLVLGITHGTEVQLAFVADNTQLGPATSSSIPGAKSTKDSTAAAPDPNVSKGKNEDPIDEQTFNVANIDAGFIGSELDTFRKGLTDSFTKIGLDSSRNVSELVNPYIAQTAASNPFVYAYEFGFADPDVPVFIAPTTGTGGINPGTIDLVGIVARRLYDKDYGESYSSSGVSIQQIQSAGYLGIDPSIDSSTFTVANTFLAHSGQDVAGGRNINDANQIWDQLRGQGASPFWTFGWVHHCLEAWQTGSIVDDEQIFNDKHQPYPPLSAVGLPPALDDNGDVTDFGHDVCASFLRFLWQEPYARAWVVVTTSHQLNVPFQGTDGPNDQWEFKGSPIHGLFKLFLGIYNPTVFDARTPDGLHYTDQSTNQIRQPLIEFMKKDENRRQGEDSANFGERFFEVIDDGTSIASNIWRAMSLSLSGILGLFRTGMMQLGDGLDKVSNMQQYANVLNKVFNDSIYYAAGEPGSLLRLADNPFTREYGEPVIEVREPFQRMHYISSFSHILSNNITENLTNVSTVVTASSDGNYPVTVYFDRGAPPERQIEKTIETGLFWDNARGNGWLGFLHPFFHPLETIRGTIKQATGSSDELLSKRVALYHLKESLKDIYTGEVVVLGDPSIRPHDLVYLSDVWSRMYGMFEVEQVVHHFTPDLGFVTSITPNAIVTVNDPCRWSMISWVWSWFSVKNIRDDTRAMLQQRGSESSQIATGGVSPADLATSLSEQLETQIKGHTQYTHGGSALVRDLAAAAASGNMGQGTVQGTTDGFQSGLDAAAGTLLSLIPGVTKVEDVIATPWNWVKDNIIDQHGCYIQYLNKDGQPMDAGLSYNQGIAVGQHHSITLLPSILGLQIDTLQDGHKRVTTNDLLQALGWNEIDVNALQRETSFWVAETNSQLLKLAGRSPDPLVFSKPEIKLVTVAKVIDGDTFNDTDGNSWRLAGINAYEVSHTIINGRAVVTDEYARTHLNVLAEAYMRKRLIDDPLAAGVAPTVVVRLSPNAVTYNRTAAVAFHNAPDGLTTAERNDFLITTAQQWPMIEWDSYMDDGRPYTINWEMVSQGLAPVILYGNKFDTDRGALGLGAISQVGG